MEQLGNDDGPLAWTRVVQRILLVFLRNAVRSESRAVHVHLATGHFPIERQRFEYVSAVAHDGPPIRLVTERSVFVPIRTRRSKERCKCRWRKRGRVQSAVVSTIKARVHEPHGTKSLEIEEHDARADHRRVVPFFDDQVWMVRDRDCDLGAPVGELFPKERWVSQEERVRVHKDGLCDIVWQQLVQEQLHEPGWIRRLG